MGAGGVYASSAADMRAAGVMAGELRGGAPRRYERAAWLERAGSLSADSHTRLVPVSFGAFFVYLFFISNWGMVRSGNRANRPLSAALTGWLAKLI